MKKLLMFFVVIPIIGNAQITENIQKVTGDWTVTRFLPAAAVGASDQVLQGYVGKTLTVTSLGIRFDDLNESECRIQSTTLVKNNTQKYFQDQYQAYSNFIPLTLPFIDIATGCNDIFYDKHVNQYIIFNWNGDFFEAVRISNS